MPKAYKDFEDYFLIVNSSYLALHEDYDHGIDFVNNKQPSHGPIYKLSENEPHVFKAYIYKH